LRFTYLGSGSQGNGLVVEVERTRVLLDCGFPLGETVRRLARKFHEVGGETSKA
jgi:phosphoribosyl 1,2-cyclic phosphodiesterase